MARWLLIALVTFHFSSIQRCWADDIRALSQHFQDTSGNIGDWIFVPQDNIKELSTAEHPGLATVRAGEVGQDIKGILKHPIGIHEYKLPWEFQLGLAQNFDVMCGVGNRTQSNHAIGLNVAVTFSDPQTWPKDRTQRPPDTHEFQLFVVHLGHNSGGVGLPQYTRDPHPETYKVWGRGDLDSNVTGDWQIPYVWVGDGSMYAGPASYQHYFRCVVHNETTLQVGIKFNASHGWNLRFVDCSRFGKITGIWEIGPIFSQDRWIPDELCPILPKERAYPIITGGNYEAGMQAINFPRPQPEPPNPTYEHYVDYCAFLSSPPIPFEHYSDDFDIPGYLGQWQIQPQSTFVETYSNPGQLTMTLVGVGAGTGFGPVGGPDLDFETYPPPWEIETCFTAPDDTIPWNYYLSLPIWNSQGKLAGFWNPGVKNDPSAGEHAFVNMLRGRSPINVVFDPKLPASILSSKPLYMLIQVLDRRHFRMAFKGKAEDPWFFSQVFDCSETLGGDVTKLGMATWSTVTGRRWGAAPGAPMYQKFMIDYIHYRYGCTEE